MKKPTKCRNGVLSLRSANQERVILPSLKAKLTKNALFIGQSAFSNFALYVIIIITATIDTYCIEKDVDLLSNCMLAQLSPNKMNVLIPGNNFYTRVLDEEEEEEEEVISPSQVFFLMIHSSSKI